MRRHALAALLAALALAAAVGLPNAGAEEPPPEGTTTTTAAAPEETTTTSSPPQETTTTTEPDAGTEPAPESVVSGDDGSEGPSAALVTPAIASAIENVLGDRFGQTKIDNGMVRVAVVGATDEDTALLRRVTRLGDRITAVPTAYSDAQLQAFLDQAEEGLSNDDPWAMGPLYEFTATEAIASVHVTSADFSDEEEAHVRSVIPAELLQLNEDPAFTVEEAHGSRVEYPPFEGGLQVEYILATNGFCSSSFVHVNGFGMFGTSSGHCAPQATWNTHPIRMGTFTVPLRANYYWNQGGNETYSDTSMWLIPAVHATSRIMISVNGTHRTVVGRWNGATPVGNDICQQGIGTLGTGECSTIAVNNQRWTDNNGITHRYHDCMDHTVTAGDSGGAVYSRPAAGQAWAAGSVWGNIGITALNGAVKGCFSRVQYAVWFHGEILQG